VSAVGAYSKNAPYAKNIRPAVASCFALNPLLTADITYSRNGRAGIGEVEYYYSTNPMKSCNQTQQNVTKPVILIDGFDHDDERKAGNIYADKLVYMSSTTNREENLADELRARGYDVVILNFPRVIIGYFNAGFFLVPIYYRGGSTFIESNAYVLVKLIQQLNTQLAAANSTEKLVIVGPSMGGQIARFALSYMEQQYQATGAPMWQHNTRLYVSLDSPHNGANTPIGDQLFLKYFAEDLGKVEAQDGLSQINSAASKELSLQHYSQLAGNTVPFRADPERGRYVSNLANAGSWPQQLRRVAVVNGSLSAQHQIKTTGTGPIADGDQAFYLRGKFAGVGLVSARVHFSPGYGNTIRVLEGHYPIGRGRNYYATGPNNSCGLDAGPGGWFGVNDEIAGKVRDRHGIILATIYSLQKNAAFIPMHSALAYQPAGGGADDFCQPLTSTNLVCAGTIPFDAYYGPTGANEEHIQLTTGNADFMRKEIFNVTPTPVLLTAPDKLCAGGIARTFAVREECNLPGRGQTTTYTWSVSIGATFGTSGLRTATGPSVTIRGDSGIDDYVTITVTATRAGSIASSPATVDVLVSSITDFALNYQPPNAATYNFSVCHDENVVFRPSYASNFDLTTTQWFAGPAGQETRLTAFDGLPSFTANVLHGPTAAPTYYSVYVKAINICNGLLEQATRPTPPSQYDYRFRSPAGGLVLLVDNNPNCYPNRPELSSKEATSNLAAYPNPADGSMLIQLKAVDDLMRNATIRLYNGQGRLVREQAATGAQCTFATADLPAGIYFLVAASNGQVLRQHVEIKH